MNRKIVILAVIFGVGIIPLVFLLNGIRKNNFSVTFNLLKDEELNTSVNQSPLMTKQLGGFQPARQGSESTSERHLPTEHSKSANLPDANLTDEENVDTPVGHRRICEILLNESGSVYSSDYLEDCVIKSGGQSSSSL